MLRLTTLAALLVLAAAGASSALADGAGGVTGAAFYVDGARYRTVNTPTDLSGTGAPAHSFDTSTTSAAYSRTSQRRHRATWATTAVAGACRRLVSRWGMRPRSRSRTSNATGDIDSDEELQTAFVAGKATVVGAGPSFVCPVIKLSGRPLA